MFKSLCNLLNTHVVRGKITTNGNCFFHALEYALHKGNIGSNRQDLFNKTRKEVASFAIQKIESQKKALFAEFTEIKRNKEEIARFYEAFGHRIDFLERFKTTKEYSNEDIIYYAALYKKVNLCIVEEEGDHRMCLICPNIPFTTKNTLFLVHSDGNHYNTFEYPIKVSSEMIHALKHLPVQSVLKEYTMTIKDFILEDLIKRIVSNRISLRKKEHPSRVFLQTFKTRKHKNKNHNHNLTRSAIGSTPNKLFKTPKQNIENPPLSVKLNRISNTPTGR